MRVASTCMCSALRAPGFVMRSHGIIMATPRRTQHTQQANNEAPHKCIHRSKSIPICSLAFGLWCLLFTCHWVIYGVCTCIYIYIMRLCVPSPISQGDIRRQQATGNRQGPVGFNMQKATYTFVFLYLYIYTYFYAGAARA